MWCRTGRFLQKLLSAYLSFCFVFFLHFVAKQGGEESGLKTGLSFPKPPEKNDSGLLQTAGGWRANKVEAGPRLIERAQEKETMKKKGFSGVCLTSALLRGQRCKMLTETEQHSVCKIKKSTNAGCLCTARGQLYYSF